MRRSACRRPAARRRPPNPWAPNRRARGPAARAPGSIGRTRRYTLTLPYLPYDIIRYRVSPAARGAPAQVQAQAERALKCAAALPAKLEPACAAAARVRRAAAAAGLPRVAAELRAALLAAQRGARSRAVGRGLDRVLAALDGRAEDAG